MDWIKDKSQIKNYFVCEFKDLFSFYNPFIQDKLEKLVKKKIRPEDNHALLIISNEEEIKDCIWSLYPLKSPSPNGYLGIFFRTYLEIIKEQVIKIIQECFKTRCILKGLNRTFIILIPKIINQASNFNHYRLISLCNFIYKIISKLLAIGLRLLLDKFIFPNRRAIVKGRWIAQNSIIA